MVINGARQIGKTYIVRKTAKASFLNYVELNLKDDAEGARLFQKEYVSNANQFYLQLSSLFGNLLGSKDDTVVFLDEIQVYPHLLTMLKALANEGRFTYIVTGSLLGITLRHTFIPMGAIEEVSMHQMDFEEFLWANGVGADSIEHLRGCFETLSPIEEGVHEVYLRRFKEFLITGGLPAAVKEFVVNKNVMRMREIHAMTFSNYRDDCSQYDIDHKLIIRRVYESLPSYMSNKVKRVKAADIENRKAPLDLYSEEFDYLIASGIALPARAVGNPKFPLLESSAKNLIKLYFNDVGLLTNLLYRSNILAVFGQDTGINLGSVYETAVAMELAAHGHDLFYFDSRKVGEVDFLINDYDSLSIVPIEVKSGNDQYNFRAIPKLVNPEGNYRLPKGYVLGNQNIVKKDGGLITLPIYCAMFL